MIITKMRDLTKIEKGAHYASFAAPYNTLTSPGLLNFFFNNLESVLAQTIHYYSLTDNTTEATVHLVAHLFDGYGDKFAVAELQMPNGTVTDTAIFSVYESS